MISRLLPVRITYAILRSWPMNLLRITRHQVSEPRCPPRTTAAVQAMPVEFKTDIEVDTASVTVRE